jgi:ferredoxin
LKNEREDMEKEYTTPRNRIYVDEEACGNAILCLKCVKVCLEHGPNLLGYANKDTPPVGEDAPKSLQEIDHKIVTRWMVLCDGCEECLRACPRGALSLVRPEPREPATRISRGDIVFCHTLRDGTKVYPSGVEEDS